MGSWMESLEPTLVSQHGLVTKRQLTATGLTDSRIGWLVKTQVLRRARRGVFALVGARETWERGLLSVVMSIDGSVASHSAAARLWGFDPRPVDRYEVTVRGGYRTPMAGATVHRSLTFTDADIAHRDGIVCTTFERTLCDCSTQLSAYQLGRVLDDGLRRGVASLRRLSGCSERLESGPGRHMSIVRALLELRGVGFDPGGSRSELLLLKVLRRAGLPAPVQQHRVTVGTQTFRPDFAWPQCKVFAEYYGLPFHIGAGAVAADSERLTALSADGWLPLIFTSTSSDGEIVERTRAALRQRGVDVAPRREAPTTCS